MKKTSPVDWIGIGRFHFLSQNSEMSRNTIFSYQETFLVLMNSSENVKWLSDVKLQNEGKNENQLVGLDTSLTSIQRRHKSLDKS